MQKHVYGLPMRSTQVGILSDGQLSNFWISSMSGRGSYSKRFCDAHAVNAAMQNSNRKRDTVLYPLVDRQRVLVDDLADRGAAHQAEIIGSRKHQAILFGAVVALRFIHRTLERTDCILVFSR